MKPSELASEYIGGLTHLHTKLSNTLFHHESNLSLGYILRHLHSSHLIGKPTAPITFLSINEHSSVSTAPHLLHHFGVRHWRLMGRELPTEAPTTVPVMLGLEVSYLPGGKIDITKQLAKRRPFIIGSRHALPKDFEFTPSSLRLLYRQLCDSPSVVTLGHPMRHLEGIDSLDWPLVFNYAHKTGTAVEINYNTFYQASAELRRGFWTSWLKHLAASGAAVTIGSDIHTRKQLRTFIALWHRIDKLSRPNELREFVELLKSTGISPDRVVTADYQRLLRWIATPKNERIKQLARHA